jgi:hypothetical protein
MIDPMFTKGIQHKRDVEYDVGIFNLSNEEGCIQGVYDIFHVNNVHSIKYINFNGIIH